MGREIRRVPPGWEHPRYTEDDAPKPSEGRPFDGHAGDYRPLYDQSYGDALAEFDPNDEECQEIGPPNPSEYRPAWTEDEATHYQVYENVTEGTPLSPPFATEDGLIDWLTTHKDFWGHGPLGRDEADADVRFLMGARVRDAGWTKAPERLLDDEGDDG